MPSRRAGIAGAVALLTTFAAPALAQPAVGQAVDASVRPGDDFYRYANGPWLAATALPAGLASYDTNSALRALNALRVRELIQAAAKAPAGGLARKVGDYYESRLDTAAIEARGLAPLAPDLAEIAAIADRTALAARLGRTLYPDDGTNSATEGIFGGWIHQDFNRADRYAVHLMQGGLGLSERDDYLDPAKADRRAAYRDHVAAVLRLAGLSEPQARAERVLALETAIARTHASAEDTADVFKTNNPWRRADFEAKAPGLDWGAYFKAAGLGGQADFIVWQPSAVIGTSALAASQPLQAWKDYLAFHTLDHSAGVLPKAFRDERLAFESRLAGAPKPPPDAVDEAVAATNTALGEAVGRLYVQRNFPPQAKAAADAMANNLRAAFRARIATAPWMSPGTRAKALAKLAALKLGLGYPDSWTDYSPLVVARGDAFGNLVRAEAFTWRRDLAKLARPAGPAEWTIEILTPQAVGAILNLSPNSMQFSAGLLQPPYFDPAGDAAANYGSAGAGMAHEIGHSFDEVGNIYDAEGRLVRWWTPADLSGFRAATAPLARQYDAYCLKPGLCVKGEQVLSEEFADLTGLMVAYDAYRLAQGGKPDAVKDGLSGDQRFFLAYARRWRRVQTDAALARQIATDIHAPAEYRADVVRNLEAWRRAFDVKPGDRLWLKPEETVRIW